MKISEAGKFTELAGLLVVTAMFVLACGTATTPVPVPTEQPTAAPFPTPNLEATVEARLQATIAAMPTATTVPTPEPTSTPTPTPTPKPIPTLFPTLIPTAEPAASARPDKLESLRTRAEEDAAIWTEQDWQRLYEIAVAEIPGFQEACSFPEFNAQMTLGWALLKAFSFAESSTKIELRVIDVQVQGDSGLVLTDVFLDGMPIAEYVVKRIQGMEATGHEPDKHEWLFIDGEWRRPLLGWEWGWEPSQGCPKAEIQ